LVAELLNADPAEAFFVGDSPSDVPAGHLAGVAVIGFANKPGKADSLAHAGADAVTTSLPEISAALRTTPRMVPS
jgi:phosphoglycolate phosphatase-like HAD superfamily hydrolase